MLVVYIFRSRLVMAEVNEGFCDPPSVTEVTRVHPFCTDTFSTFVTGAELN
jgi:hypothetical protein